MSISPRQLSGVQLPRIHRNVANHIDHLLELLPEYQHTPLLERYLSIYRNQSERHANLFITRLRMNIFTVQYIPIYQFTAFLSVFVNLMGSPKRLEDKMELIKNIRGFKCIHLDIDELKGRAKAEADHCIEMLATSCRLFQLESYAKGIGVEKVAGDNDGKEKRLVDDRWWLFQLRDIRSQGQENLAQILGVVTNYISTSGYNYEQAKHEATILMLSENVAVSPDGKDVSLLDIARTAIRGRFSRLLCWSDGMGDYAKNHGHSCAMFSITCPSKMHPNSSEYDGTTARKAQQYLAEMWNKANSQFKREGVYPYGIRVSEPHKDGCPHWHIMLFAPLDVLYQIDVILRDYAFRQDGDELGAAAHRYDYKLIDQQAGGAKPSSYLFKYLMKGLGGDADTYTSDDVGKIITDQLTEVRAWAKKNKIRQVQIVGGASVGVWDELRKIEGELGDEYLESMRVACNDNDFSTYFTLQGGHTMGKQSHYAKLARDSSFLISERVDTDTGEIATESQALYTPYGELMTRVVGIKYGIDHSNQIGIASSEWSINWQRSRDNHDNVTIHSNTSLDEGGYPNLSGSLLSVEELKAYEADQGWK